MKWKKLTRKANLNRFEVNQLAEMFDIDESLIEYMAGMGLTDEKQISEFLFPKWSRLTPLDSVPNLKEVYNKITNSKGKVRIICSYELSSILSVVIIVRALELVNVKFQVTFLDENTHYDIKPMHLTCLPKSEKLIIFVGSIFLDETLQSILNERNVTSIILSNIDKSLNLKKVQSLSNIKLAAAAFAIRFLEYVLLQKNLNIDIYHEKIIAAIGILSDNQSMLGDNRIIASCGLEYLHNESSKLFSYLKERLKIQAYTYTNIKNNISPLLDNILNFGGSAELLLMLNVSNFNKRKWNMHIRQNNKRNKYKESFIKEAHREVVRSGNQHQSPIIIEGDYPIRFQESIAQRLAYRFNKCSIVLDKLGSGTIQVHPDENKDLILERISSYSLKPINKRTLKFFPDNENYNVITKSFNNLDVINHDNISYYLDDINISKFPEELVEDLRLFEPFGKDNPQIYFLSKDVVPSKVTKFSNDLLLLNFNEIRSFHINKQDHYKKLLRQKPLTLIYSLHSSRPLMFKIIDIKFPQN